MLYSKKKFRIACEDDNLGLFLAVRSKKKSPPLTLREFQHVLEQGAQKIAAVYLQDLVFLETYIDDLCVMLITASVGDKIKKLRCFTALQFDSESLVFSKLQSELDDCFTLVNNIETLKALLEICRMTPKSYQKKIQNKIYHTCTLAHPAKDLDLFMALIPYLLPMQRKEILEHLLGSQKFIQNLLGLLKVYHAVLWLDGSEEIALLFPYLQAQFQYSLEHSEILSDPIQKKLQTILKDLMWNDQLDVIKDFSVMVDIKDNIQVLVIAIGSALDNDNTHLVNQWMERLDPERIEIHPGKNKMCENLAHCVDRLIRSKDLLQIEKQIPVLFQIKSLILTEGVYKTIEDLISNIYYADTFLGICKLDAETIMMYKHIIQDYFNVIDLNYLNPEQAPKFLKKMPQFLQMTVGEPILFDRIVNFIAQHELFGINFYPALMAAANDEYLVQFKILAELQFLEGLPVREALPKKIIGNRSIMESFEKLARQPEGEKWCFFCIQREVVPEKPHPEHCFEYNQPNEKSKKKWCIIS